MALACCHPARLLTPALARLPCLPCSVFAAPQVATANAEAIAKAAGVSAAQVPQLAQAQATAQAAAQVGSQDRVGQWRQRVRSTQRAFPALRGRAGMQPPSLDTRGASPRRLQAFGQGAQANANAASMATAGTVRAAARGWDAGWPVLAAPACLHQARLPTASPLPPLLQGR